MKSGCFARIPATTFAGTTDTLDRNIHRRFAVALLLSISLALGACATEPRLVEHSPRFATEATPEENGSNSQKKSPVFSLSNVPLIVDAHQYINGLTKFFLDFSNHKNEIEKNFMQLLNIQNLEIKNFGQTAIIGGKDSTVLQAYVNIHDIKNIGISVDLLFRSDICFTEQRWLKILDDTLTIKHFAKDADNQMPETAWKEISGGPHWPAGAVLRSKRLANGIGVSYRYFFSDQLRCINSPEFTFPMNLEISK